MRKNIPIQQVTLATDVTIAKINGDHGALFSLPILYHLAGGRIIATTYTASRKKDVVAYSDQLPLIPTNPTLEAEFDDDDKFIGTAQIWDLSR